MPIDAQTPKHTKTPNMSKTQNSQIPLDTLGHPLPPPVRPEHICRIPKRDWGKWWTRYYNDTLDKELDCSVCGLSFPEPTLIPLDRAILDPAIQKRALNTTGDRVRVCRGCKAVCSRCGGTIISAQKQKYEGLCQVCVHCVRENKTKKRKTPSGS